MILKFIIIIIIIIIIFINCNWVIKKLEACLLEQVDHRIQPTHRLRLYVAFICFVLDGLRPAPKGKLLMD